MRYIHLHFTYPVLSLLTYLLTYFCWCMYMDGTIYLLTLAGSSPSLLTFKQQLKCTCSIAPTLVFPSICSSTLLLRPR